MCKIYFKFTPWGKMNKININEEACFKALETNMLKLWDK